MQIQLEQVSKEYEIGDRKLAVLKNIGLEINQGDFLSILGPSGSGKSTLVTLIGCLDVPSKGKIFLFKEDISKLEESDLAVLRGKKLGFVFQAFNLIKNLSAKENVMLAMGFQEIPLEVRKRRASELLESVGLSKRENHKPNELSGGEQQRVAIARALANDPDIILADEPTGNLDSKTGEIIMNLLKELNERGKTVVIITHDRKIAKKTKKQVFLKDGEMTGGKE